MYLFEVCITLLVSHFSFMTMFNILVLSLYFWSVLTCPLEMGRVIFVSISELRLSGRGFTPCPWSRKHCNGGGGPKSSLFPLYASSCAVCIHYICTNQQVGLVTFPKSLVISSRVGWGHAIRFLLQQLDWISGGLVAKACPFLAVCCAIVSPQPHTQTPAGQGEEWEEGVGYGTQAKRVSNNKTKWPNHCTLGKKNILDCL